MPPLEITRGCFWNCRYCQTGENRPRHRGKDSISSYLEELRRRGFSRAGFIAPSALEYGTGRQRKPDLGCIERLLEICRLAGFKFIEFGIFPSEIRPDTVSAEGLGLLRRYVANRRLTFGAQSAVDARLDPIGRGHTSAQITPPWLRPMLPVSRSTSILSSLCPVKPPPSGSELLEFIARLRKKCRVHIQLHHFFPLAGSAFAWRLPSFLGADERQDFSALKKNGLASDWWQEGEQSVRAYFSWLEHDFPDYFAQFT